jgi:hypothetical protein
VATTASALTAAPTNNPHHSHTPPLPVDHTLSIGTVGYGWGRNDKDGSDSSSDDSAPGTTTRAAESV